jgi:hypothetical protein
VVCRCVFGSRAYSLETDDSEIDLRGGYSDYDLRGAHVLPLEKVLSLDVRDETVQDSLGFAETQWRLFSKEESPTTQQRDRRSILRREFRSNHLSFAQKTMIFPTGF